MFIAFNIIAFLIYFLILACLSWGMKRLDRSESENLPLVSVIVAMRNEEKNVDGIVSSLVNQQYPQNLLEIIIVDDNSDDDTADKLRALGEKFQHLKIIHRRDEAYKGNKKLSLRLAIEQSKGEILLFTDADCRPQADWVRATVKNFDAKTGVVLGLSPWIGSKSFLHKIIYIDSLAVGLVALGSAGMKAPVTCTGRNLAYRKSIFDEVNGYAAIEKSVSGDDDLFLQLVHHKTNWKIKATTAKGSVVPSFHNFSWQNFFRQKRRHLSAGKYYSLNSSLSYGIYHIANLWLWASPCWTFFGNEAMILPFMLLAIKFTIDRMAIAAVHKLYYRKFVWYDFLGWEMMFLFYNVVLAPLSWFGKIKWR